MFFCSYLCCLDFIFNLITQMRLKRNGISLESDSKKGGENKHNLLMRDICITAVSKYFEIMTALQFH
jgi:hypothetical protein